MTAFYAAQYDEEAEVLRVQVPSWCVGRALARLTGQGSAPWLRLASVVRRAVREVGAYPGRGRPRRSVTG